MMSEAAVAESVHFLGDPQLELPDLANKSTGHPVKLVFQINNEYFLV